MGLKGSQGWSDACLWEKTGHFFRVILEGADGVKVQNSNYWVKDKQILEGEYSFLQASLEPL